MNYQRRLWNFLAKRNSRYFIYSDKGNKITEETFKKSGFKDTMKLIIEDELINKSGVLLEIGCGTGRMTEYMAGNFYEVIGTDISIEMIKQGRERMKDLNNVLLIETDGSTLPIEDNLIDTAFSYLVFQHFRTRKMIKDNFAEVYRVLKPGGIFKVLVRTDKVVIHKWWSGVDCDEKIAIKAGFTLLQKDYTKENGLWLWLQK